MADGRTCSMASQAIDWTHADKYLTKQLIDLSMGFNTRHGSNEGGLWAHFLWATADLELNRFFLHAKPWIPGGEKSIYTVVIHWWRSPLRQFARARTIDEYDVTLTVPHVRVTSQINCGDVTVLSQKRPCIATLKKSTIDKFFSGIVCSWYKTAHNK